MRPWLFWMSLIVLTSCKKETRPEAPPLTSAAAPAVSVSAASSASGASPAGPVFHPQLRAQAWFKGVPGMLFVTQGQNFFRVLPDKIVQEPQFLRGLPDVVLHALLGSAEGPLFAVVGESAPEVANRFVSSAYRRVNEQWVRSDLSSAQSYEVLVGVAPWSHGRHLGLVAMLEDRDARFALAGGKGPVALPRFAPLPPLPRPSATAVTSAAPSAPSRPVSSPASAAASAPASASSGVPAAPPPRASAAASVEIRPQVAPEGSPAEVADPRGCRQRMALEIAHAQLSFERLGALPSGHVFVAGFDCNELPATRKLAPAVERWVPDAKKSSFDLLPRPSSPLTSLALHVARADLAYVLGSVSEGPSYFAVFDGERWKREDLPEGGLAGAWDVDAAGHLWVLLGASLGHRSPEGTWSTSPLAAPPPTSTLALLGQELWVSTGREVLSTRPAPAEVVELGKVRNFNDGDLPLAEATPLCETVTALLQSVGDSAQKPPASSPVADVLKGKVADGVELAAVDLGGLAYLALQGKSVSDVRKAVALAREKNPRTFDRVVCQPARRLKTYELK